MILEEEELWKEYVQGKQTYTQLAEKYACPAKTIKRKLDDYSVKKTARKVIVLMDTTYWERTFGVMLFKDAITKENLLKYYVKNETNALYIQGIEELKDKGFEIIAIVCDGRKGLLQSFGDIPLAAFGYSLVQQKSLCLLLHKGNPLAQVLRRLSLW